MVTFTPSLALTASALAAAGFLTAPAYAATPAPDNCPAHTLCLYPHPYYEQPAREVPAGPGCRAIVPEFRERSEINNSDAVAVLYQDATCGQVLRVLPPHGHLPLTGEQAGAVRFERRSV